MFISSNPFLHDEMTFFATLFVMLGVKASVKVCIHLRAKHKSKLILYTKHTRAIIGTLAGGSAAITSKHDDELIGAERRKCKR